MAVVTVLSDLIAMLMVTERLQASMAMATATAVEPLQTSTVTGMATMAMVTVIDVALDRETILTQLCMATMAIRIFTLRMCNSSHMIL